MPHDIGGSHDSTPMSCRDYFIRWGPRLWRYACILNKCYPTPNREPAMLLDQTYQALCRKWESRCVPMSEDERFAYVYRTMRRIAINERRVERWMRNRFPLVEPDEEVLTERSEHNDPTAETVVQNDENRRRAAIIDGLPHDDRLMLYLHHRDGLKQHEIADRFGLKPYEVSRKLRRVVCHLRAALAAEDDGAGDPSGGPR